jgi:TonB-linked SusC/RagA family outer membrane protein
MVDFNFGYTGSENFERGKRFGFFPAISFGWVPSQYDYVKDNLPWVNLFKIRASYGQVGNDRISDTRFPYLTLVNENASGGWGYNTNLYGGGAITELSIGANNLQWEVANKSNLGFDVELLKDKLKVNLDIWHDRRSGIFQTRQNIPLHVGLAEMPYGNVGVMTSHGSEGNVSYTHEINRDMDFTIRANYTYAVNEVKNWEQVPQLYDYQNYSGYPHQAVRGYIALGLFENEQDVASSPLQNFMATVYPGDIKYKDVNGDGVINTDDRVPLSYPTFPRFNFGFGGEFRWKDLTVSLLFKGTGKNDFYYVGQSVTQLNTTFSNGMGYVPFHNGVLGNVLDIVADPKNRWIPEEISGDPSTENPNARFPRLHYQRNANNSQLSTFWKANKQFIRFQELMLSYNWKSDIFKKIGIRSVDLQLVGNNLYVWDGVNIFDPEQAQFDGRAYPIPLRVTFQAYIHF